MFLVTLMVLARTLSSESMWVQSSLHHKYILPLTHTHTHSLCRRTSSRIKGLPFRPISATPVDLFPHTPHCEVVLLLERVTLGELSGKPDTAGYRVDEVVSETQDKEIVVDETRGEEEDGEKINALSTLDESVRASSEGVNSAVEDTNLNCYIT